MKKDIITLENIRSDLDGIALERRLNRSESRLVQIIGSAIIAVIIGLYFRYVFIALVFSACSAYQLYFHIIESREYKKREKALKDALDRFDISISVEELDHIEESYDRDVESGSRLTDTKCEDYYHFKEGSSRRAPLDRNMYWYSENYKLSSNGLKNITVVGDKYYYVSLNGYYDIAYIYPCKFFELDSSLEIKK